LLLQFGWPLCRRRTRDAPPITSRHSTNFGDNIIEIVAEVIEIVANVSQIVANAIEIVSDVVEIVFNVIEIVDNVIEIDAT
jgi:hypothetical protein